MDPAHKKNTGLLFGSFNPVHSGHLIIADHMLQYTNLEEIWFVLSPLNPFKAEAKLLGEQERLNLLKAAIQGNPDFHACDLELSMQKPSYTINTLKELHRRHQERTFVLIAGSDNLADFDQWKDHHQIFSLVPIYIYPRGDTEKVPFMTHPAVTFVNAPKLDISSTLIRTMIATGKHPRYLLPEAVLTIVKHKGYYGMQPSG